MARNKTNVPSNVRILEAALAEIANKNVELARTLQTTQEDLDQQVSVALQRERDSQRRIKNATRDYDALKAIIIRAKSTDNLPNDPQVYVNRVIHMRAQLNLMRNRVEELEEQIASLKAQLGLETTIADNSCVTMALGAENTNSPHTMASA